MRVIEILNSSDFLANYGQPWRQHQRTIIITAVIAWYISVYKYFGTRIRLRSDQHARSRSSALPVHNNQLIISAHSR